MASLSPRNVALTDQILATLAGEGGLPISTMALLEKISPRPRTIAERLATIDRGQLVLHSDLLRLLNRLATLGEVEKIKLDGMRSVYWRRWMEPAGD